jgi:hypothetical protein
MSTRGGTCGATGTAIVFDSSGHRPAVALQQPSYFDEAAEPSVSLLGEE